MLQVQLARRVACFFIAAVIFAASVAVNGQPRETEAFQALANKLTQLYEQEKYAEALPIAEQTLALATRIHGSEHADTLGIAYNLASLHFALGHFAEAEPLFRDVLATSERALGHDAPHTIATAATLAALYRAQSRNAEAEPLLQRVMETNERVQGRDHRDTLESINTLAELYLAERRYDAAEPLHQRVLEANERILGAAHPDTVASLNRLAALLIAQNRYGEAEPLYRRAMEVRERDAGPDDPSTLSSVNKLAWVNLLLGRYDEAEALYQRALEGCIRVFGEEHANTLIGLDNLGNLYRVQGRYREAEPLILRSLSISERILDEKHPDTLTIVTNLAALYKDQGRYRDAEPLYRRALEGRELSLGREHRDTLGSVNNLAELYRAQGRYDEAEPLYHRALEAQERVLGKDHPDTLVSVTNLAALYRFESRQNEAISLTQRGLEGRERVLGKEHPDTLLSVNNLAELYKDQRRYGEAEPLYRRALEANERIRGKDHPDTLTSVDNLATLLGAERRNEEAGALYRRALDGCERVLGNVHPVTLGSMNNLAFFYLETGNFAEAERLYRRALQIAGPLLGEEHPDTLVFVNNLALLHFAQSAWPAAAREWRRAVAGAIGRSHLTTLNVSQSLRGDKQTEAERKTWQFSSLVKTLYRMRREGTGNDADLTDESFRMAQWALNSSAAKSLTQMAERGATDNSDLAELMREQQDPGREWQKRDELRIAALGAPPDKRNAKAEAENIARLGAVQALVSTIDTKLTAQFPNYAALVSPEPLTIEGARGYLGPDEALILLLDTNASRPTPEETFIWVVTRDAVRWVRSDLGREGLTRAVSTLRCGLDEEEWATPTKAGRCADLLGLGELPDSSRPLPFDLGKAHALHKALFGQVEDLIAGKRLLIIPSGPLASLPFHVLVTKAPEMALPERFEDYRGVAWLGRAHAVATLPAVSNLKALRTNVAPDWREAGAYAGYGDPLLKGESSSCRSPKVPERCPGSDLPTDAAAASDQAKVNSEPARATVRGRGGGRSANATTDEIFAKGTTPEALLEQVRGLCPLPDTAYEIRCVADSYKKEATHVRLGGEAREKDIKDLSAGGQLARYRVLHFATHGLLSGDVETMAHRQGEPALVLTPPDAPTDANDDGLLMTSEVTSLKLNADWVVLSACNTAAGGAIGAEALSGLARAFFYAGARALMVSHWSVYSDAAVRLTTRTFTDMDRTAKVGRAEALKQAMIALMDDHSQGDNAHPAVWAPFVVVGEGGR